jgi:hypothetical protein
MEVDWERRWLRSWRFTSRVDEVREEERPELQIRCCVHTTEFGIECISVLASRVIVLMIYIQYREALQLKKSISGGFIMLESLSLSLSGSANSSCR